MVNIKLEPYNRIIVRDYIRHASPEAFAIFDTTSVPDDVKGKVGGFFWANGILFRHAPFQASESVSKEYIAGRLFIDSLQFAPMPKYVSEIKVPRRSLVVPVLNVSESQLFDALSKWIKKQIQKK